MALEEQKNDLEKELNNEKKNAKELNISLKMLKDEWIELKEKYEVQVNDFNELEEQKSELKVKLSEIKKKLHQKVNKIVKLRNECESKNKELLDMKAACTNACKNAVVKKSNPKNTISTDEELLPKPPKRQKIGPKSKRSNIDLEKSNSDVEKDAKPLKKSQYDKKFNEDSKMDLEEHRNHNEKELNKEKKSTRQTSEPSPKSQQRQIIPKTLTLVNLFDESA